MIEINYFKICIIFHLFKSEGVIIVQESEAVATGLQLREAVLAVPVLVAAETIQHQFTKWPSAIWRRGAETCTGTAGPGAVGGFLIQYPPHCAASWCAAPRNRLAAGTGGLHQRVIVRRGAVGPDEVGVEASELVRALEVVHQLGRGAGGQQ